MSVIPQWVTSPGTLGTIPEGVFYSTPLVTSATDPVYYKVIAGSLPPGVQINKVGILSGIPTTPVHPLVSSIIENNTSKFTVRAYTDTLTGKIADRTFTITVVPGLNTLDWNTPAGLIGTYFDGTLISDLTVSYSDTDIRANDVVTLISGSLPPGLTVSTKGVISGYITPNLTTHISTHNYTFTLQVTNGVSTNLRTFSILVYARVTMTADNDQLPPHADNTFVTADTTPTPPPVITTPTGSIGTTRSDNFYAFQFEGVDYSGSPIKFIATTELPPGLTLDPNSGWLYGFIPYGGVVSTDYPFSIIIELANDPTYFSNPYSYSLTITGPVNTDVIWLTPTDTVERNKSPSNLGFIDNGATSTFYVAAENVSGIPIQYRLLSGSNSRLPQGLQLLPNGTIAGRVSFDTFCLDGGTTTFDVGLNTVDQPTTFDLVAIFTVNAFSVNGLININKTFSITVVRRYDQPYDNLYVQAMPPLADRALLSDLLQNLNVFPPGLIYRGDDLNFGVARQVVYNHAYGLTASTLNNYIDSLYQNHYWKNLVLGEIETAQALDDNGNILYEVVYSKVVDNLVNNDNVSVGKNVLLSYPFNGPDDKEISVVYPNSLQNMRDQVIDTVGQVSNVLPRWMLSRQPNGRVLGFTPAWILAYTKPGKGSQIAYNVQNYFASSIGGLSLVDFKVDRYEVDQFLVKNWLPANMIDVNTVSGTGNIVTLTYDLQPSAPFAVNQAVTLSNVVPSVYNNTYTVSACTPTFVQFTSNISNNYISGGSVSSKGTWRHFDPVNIISIVGDGSSVTVDFDPQPVTTPFPAGSKITLNGVAPFLYNGTYIVTSANNQSITFNSSITDSYVFGGTVVSQEYVGYANATPSVTTFDQSKELATWINNANVLTTWEDDYNTLATWTYGTPGPNNLGTIFDGGSLQFITPVDMYSSTSTTEFDKYLLFPKYNIIDNVPNTDNTIVLWYNDYSEFVKWVNDTGNSINWVSQSI